MDVSQGLTQAGEQIATAIHDLASAVREHKGPDDGM